MKGRKRKLPSDFIPAPWLSSSEDEEPPAQRVQRPQVQQQPEQVVQQEQVQQQHRRPQNNDEIFVESGNEMFLEEPDNVNMDGYPIQVQEQEQEAVLQEVVLPAEAVLHEEVILHAEADLHEEAVLPGPQVRLQEGEPQDDLLQDVDGEADVIFELQEEAVPQEGNYIN